MTNHAYDPFIRGLYPVGVRTIEAPDQERNRLFPCEIWFPAAAKHQGQDLEETTWDVFTAPQGNSRSQMAVRNAETRRGTYPLIVFSHHSGGGRRSATYLCTHLASHGYVVAALDHSEVIAPEFARKEDETKGQKSLRVQAWIASRVPDIRFLLNHLLSDSELLAVMNLNLAQVGIVGHSFGGWTALAATDTEPRIASVVGLAPGGASQQRPGILQANLTFNWGRNVPTLYLVAENDVSLPLSGMYEIFERTPSTKQMMILRRADHMHFMDHAEEIHEMVRKMPWPEELSWLPKEMRPIEELCSEKEAHLFVQGLALAHLDATLKNQPDAQNFLAGDIQKELAQRNVDAILHLP
jgi:predicted dienelactone hydrolase